MAFRRSNNFKRRSVSSRSRFSRNRTHEPRKSGHWQRCNMFLQSENVVDQEATHFNTVLVLGEILGHLGRSQETDTQQIRFLEIGGVVFDWQMQLTDTSFDYTSPPTQDYWRISNQLLLCSDRLDVDGNPCAIDVNWFSSTTPIPLATAAEVQDEDQRFPTRVHWRHARNINGGYAQFPDVTGDYSPVQSVVSLQGSANLRLRLRLDDEHALVFHWSSIIAEGGSTLSAAAIMATIAGSMYYRVVY